MALFEKAINTILEHEGGFVDDPLDSGGATNFGISLHFYKTIKPDATVADIKNLTRQDAITLYEKHFWLPNKLNLIASQEVATKVFDLAVNMGSVIAIKCLQRAAISSGGNALDDDGIIGTRTLAAVNLGKWDSILAALRSEAAGYYRVLVAKVPSQNKFLNGWLSRAYS